MRPSPPQNSTLEVEYAELSDSGKVREHNEDYLGRVAPANPAEGRTRGWLFALADGVGGQAHGEIASRTAVEHLLAGFRSAATGEALAALLPHLVQAANHAVYEAGMRAAPGGVAMATTLVACALRYDRMVVAHVGDSRCYLIRRGHAMLLTRDHTIANEQVRLGIISSRQAEDTEARHVLLRSLGSNLFANVESSEHLIVGGDVLVLCSDGLHGSVSGADMARVVGRSPTLETAAQSLVELANERDGNDNISVQLIRVRGVERVGMYRGRPYKLR
jgi:protein phosphatase